MKLGRYVTGLTRWTEVRDVAGNSRLVALATDVRGHHRCGRVWHLLRHEASPGRLVRRPSNRAVDLERKDARPGESSHHTTQTSAGFIKNGGSAKAAEPGRE